MNRLKSIFNRIPLLFFIIVGLHFFIAVIYKEFAGVDIAANPRFRPWDWWWQTIPVDLLVNRLWESIWYLHAQPPIYNLYGALFFKLFPGDPLSFMQYGNILLGSLIPGLYFLTLYQMTRKLILSFLVGLFFALDAGLFLFEAYMLYDLLTTFLIASSVCLFAYYENTHKSWYAYLFILVLNLLVLTRSAYHILILPLAIILIYLTSRLPRPIQLSAAAPAEDDPSYSISTRARWRMMGVVILVCVFSFGWYAKNKMQYGFFGASSWQGFSMWEIQSTSFTEEKLRELGEENIINPIAAELPAFSLPSEYRKYGYDQTSDIALLNQDDFHNINVIDIAKIYQKSAMNLMVNFPRAYLGAIKQAYLIYNSPVAQFRHHSLNIEKIQWHAKLTAKIFQGQILEDVLGIRFGSFYSLLIPFSIVLFGFSVVFRSISLRENIILSLVSLPTELWMLLLIGYTTFVGVFLEIGENLRERFYIEQLVIVFIVVVIARMISQNKMSHVEQEK